VARTDFGCQVGRMLLILTGSSGSGKTTLARALGDRLSGVAIHDHDEIGVPEDADTRWRNRTTEQWIRRALEYQNRGVDVVLTGQSPLGEILASPSAPQLDGIAVCLVHVADEERRRRLEQRDGGRWSPAVLDSFVGWGAWHRGHAEDPRYRPDVIIDGSWPDMAWDRWSAWTKEDPRWDTYLLDTTRRSQAQSVDELERWLVRQRSAHRAGQLALSKGWIDVES
jgi:molybdopterin-guanine dinucleotide biosynthesis protein